MFRADSLGTSDLKHAAKLRAIRNAEVEVQFATARGQLGAQAADPAVALKVVDSATLDYIRDAVRSHVLQEDEEARKARPRADDLEGYEQLRSDEFDDAGSALKSGRVGLTEVDRQRIDLALQAVGVSVPRQSSSWGDATYRATEGLNLALQGIRERMNAEYLPTPPMPVKQSLMTHVL